MWKKKDSETFRERDNGLLRVLNLKNNKLRYLTKKKRAGHQFQNCKNKNNYKI